MSQKALETPGISSPKYKKYYLLHSVTGTLNDADNERAS